jgi:hypothetical protein
LWWALASGDETGGGAAALDERCTHGVLAALRAYDGAAEIFYVLDGTRTFFVGGRRIEATPRGVERRALESPPGISMSLMWLVPRRSRRPPGAGGSREFEVC